MSALDWTVFAAFLTYVVWDGLRRTARNRGAEDVFLAGRSAPWWVMGFSIMATQASAITMVGTTGKGWQGGLRFIQFYYALPIAMVIIAFVFVPRFHKHQVFTIYEYLGKRFDLKTRSLAALIFLVQRCLAAAFVILAPSIVFSALFGVELAYAILGTGGIALLYTSFGGMRAVLATDVKQMIVMIVGLVIAFFTVANNLPEDVGFAGALKLADATDRLVVADFRFDPTERFTIWTGLFGGLFLFLGYFGADQSQAQRYLAGRSVGHQRGALLLNAVAKVPFQLLVLLTGTLIFIGQFFEPVPVTFVPGERDVLAGQSVSSDQVAVAARAFLQGESESDRLALVAAVAQRDQDRELRRAAALRETGRTPASETNYVFPYYILGSLPRGLVGLLIAAIFAAALSSIDSELNAMATVAVMDGSALFGRSRVRGDGSVRASRWATLIIGVITVGTALALGATGSADRALVEAVNDVGSLFYGSLLGAFLLAFFVPAANGTGAFWGLVSGLVAVAVAKLYDLPFLYLNTLGAAVCVVVAVAVSPLKRAE